MNIRWSTAIRSRNGRLAASTLMGDAAHPMYPIGSNGASQAFWMPACSPGRSRRTARPNAALVAYEAERRPATTDLVMLNRRNGPEQVMQTGRGARAQRV